MPPYVHRIFTKQISQNPLNLTLGKAVKYKYRLVTKNIETEVRKMSKHIIEKIKSGEIKEHVEIVKFGPYRFIGKTIYLRAGSRSAAWEAVCKDAKDWVFPKLDEMSEYATEETYTVALYDWSRYDDKECLLGFCVGRFMKPNTPVPQSGSPDNDGFAGHFDYYDIPEILVCKSFMAEKNETGDPCNLGRDFAEKNGYEHSSKFSLSAEVFSDRIESPNGKNFDGFYESFEKVFTAEELIEQFNNLPSNIDAKAASDICNDIGFKLRKRKKYSEALAAYEKAIEILPEQTDLHYVRHAGILRLLENHEKAIELYSIALSMGKDRWARAERGLSYFALGKIDEAKSDYNELCAQIKAEGENPDNWYDLYELRELVK